MTTSERIEEVLLKYGVRLPAATIDAVALAMDHRSEMKVADTNRSWLSAAKDALHGDTHALQCWIDAAEGKV